VAAGGIPLDILSLENLKSHLFGIIAQGVQGKRFRTSIRARRTAIAAFSTR
jgi:hypothetical protein